MVLGDTCFNISLRVNITYGKVASHLLTRVLYSNAIYLISRSTAFMRQEKYIAYAQAVFQLFTSSKP